MNRKKVIIFSATGIVIVLLALLSVTYGYFATQVLGNTNRKSIYVTSATYTLLYAEEEDTMSELTSIEPGVMATKKFTVSNIGNTTVDSYGVYLEDVINTFSRTEDLVITLTCKEYDADGNYTRDCNGIDTNFPTNNQLLVTNSIGAGYIQKYTFSFEYVYLESIDQSADIGSTLSGLIQIYHEPDVVTLTGTVSGHSEGSYIEISGPSKISYILDDNTYSVTALSVGEHTIYLKDSSGNTVASKTINISKTLTGSESISADGTELVIIDETNIITMDIIVSGSTMTLNPAEKDLSTNTVLANRIIENAKLGNVGRTYYSTSPLTTPALVIGGYTFVKGSTLTSESTKDVGNYYIYSSEYTVNPSNGKFTLVDPIVISYSSSNLTTLKGKYISNIDGYNNRTYASNFLTTEFSSIYLVGTSSTSSRLYYSEVVSSASGDVESVLSITDDDDGTSYYFRGQVEDNYVEFNNMCWRVVRIEGDGAIKLTLAKEGLCSTISDSDTTSALINSSVTYGTTDDEICPVEPGESGCEYNYESNADYESGGLKSALSSWYTSSGLNKAQILLKKDVWCLDSGAGAHYNYVDLSYSDDSWADEETGEIPMFYEWSYDYAGGNRLFTEKYTTLVCSSGTTVTSYIGTLTGDEVALAGASNGSNAAYYLYANANENYWTLTISDHYYIQDSGGWDSPMITKADGALSTLTTDESSGVRPSITLTSGIITSQGDGTISNPYVVSNEYITFSIYDDVSGETTTYYAQKGMTWGEWVNSSFNTDDYYSVGDDGGIEVASTANETMRFILVYETEGQSSDTKIEDGMEYETIYDA